MKNHMFKNKHIIIAMVVAPLLAVGSYFIVDFMVSEQPHIAKKGESYELLAKSNCRYQSGRCTFVNGDFVMSLQAQRLDDGRMRLVLESVHSLDGVKLALINDSYNSSKPAQMNADNHQRTRWVINLLQPQSEKTQLRIVSAAGGAVYYAQTPATFLNDKTAFNKGLRTTGR